ncbi:MarR family winged helix-turn-helix transcriptional regulator [Antribacter sp. KLBMP9083]|uniref:MarR family winged helix-turn-helix transcriptional regulator n=1 Tax=Antribacter soli TaxID=2910976 RepID=A0AA41QED6_9MICO|nr:MarR family winged helix-turn-helix transcriptional regulator [Antribacter soli]MCF4121924.1 MarR family winged helix-turn-helix transcriptional regulator [Antribacter soli]
MEDGAGERTAIAIELWDAVQRVTRTFDRVLAEHGGTRPVWFILLALGTGRPATQRQLAAAVGIREATLTHHLRAMEDRGLVTRHRDPANRRVQQIEVTPEGLRLFAELKEAAVDFDSRLRHALGSREDVVAFRGALRRLTGTVPGGPATVPFE